MNNKWKFLTGDICFTIYGGKWYKQISDTVYHVIELLNLHECTGDETIEKYNVSLQEIDLAKVSQHDLDSAMSCCGLEINESDITPVITIEVLSDYGLYAPMGNWSGNNYKQLLGKAKFESLALTVDRQYHKKQLNRPVNLLGSTASEAAKGDYNSALIRGIAKGDKTARLMGKIHGLTEDDMQDIAEIPEARNWNRQQIVA